MRNIECSVCTAENLLRYVADWNYIDITYRNTQNSKSRRRKMAQKYNSNFAKSTIEMENYIT
jgi:hypothetical protein